MRFSISDHDPFADRIRKLENDLWLANRTIVALAPEPFPTKLSSYHNCQTRKDFWEWKSDAVAAVVDAAIADPEISYSQPRGYCPLCRGGSIGPYDRGFSIPEGLSRHLEGRGNTSECPVTKAAFWLAQHGLAEQFDVEDRNKQATVLNRRKNERLFLVSPDDPPRLLDEYIFGSPRDDAGLEAAEQRLHALGFVQEKEG